MNLLSLFRKNGKAEKVVDESVLTDAFLKTINVRLLKCCSKATLDLPILVSRSSTHSPTGREWLLSSGEGYAIRDVALLQAQLLKNLLVNLADEFQISATDEGQFCLSLLLDEAQGQVDESGEYVEGSSLLIVVSKAVLEAVEGIADESKAEGLVAMKSAYTGLLSRFLMKDLTDFFRDYPRLITALAKLEGSRGPHLVQGSEGSLKSFLDKTLQKDKPVLFDDLYTRDTSNTFKKEAQ